MPLASTTTTPLDQSYHWCCQVARRTAGNFYFSFLTLPREQFRDMCVLYAFMRVSDDIGDDESLPVEVRIERLEAWRASLAAALNDGAADGPVLPALTDVVQRYQIPHAYFFDVLDGIRDDLQFRGFDTFQQLEQYCYRVAGVVGLCCIHVWGFRGERATGHAVDCGLAFQLTNILRDLAEDADRGRVYLPREDLRRFGYTAEDILARRRDGGFRDLMQFQVERAQACYDRARELFALLEPPGRPIYAAMLRIYGGLLDAIERRHYDVYTRRVRLSKCRKLLIAGDAIVRHRWLDRGLHRI